MPEQGHLVKIAVFKITLDVLFQVHIMRAFQDLSFAVALFCNTLFFLSFWWFKNRRLKRKPFDNFTVLFEMINR